MTAGASRVRRLRLRGPSVQANSRALALLRETLTEFHFPGLPPSALVFVHRVVLPKLNIQRPEQELKAKLLEFLQHCPLHLVAARAATQKAEAVYFGSYTELFVELLAQLDTPAGQRNWLFTAICRHLDLTPARLDTAALVKQVWARQQAPGMHQWLAAVAVDHRGGHSLWQGFLSRLSTEFVRHLHPANSAVGASPALPRVIGSAAQNSTLLAQSARHLDAWGPEDPRSYFVLRFGFFQGLNFLAGETQKDQLSQVFLQRWRDWQLAMLQQQGPQGLERSGRFTDWLRQQGAEREQSKPLTPAADAPAIAETVGDKKFSERAALPEDNSAVLAQETSPAETVETSRNNLVSPENTRPQATQGHHAESSSAVSTLQDRAGVALNFSDTGVEQQVFYCSRAGLFFLIRLLTAWGPAQVQTADGVELCLPYLSFLYLVKHLPDDDRALLLTVLAPDERSTPSLAELLPQKVQLAEQGDTRSCTLKRAIFRVLGRLRRFLLSEMNSTLNGVLCEPAQIRFSATHVEVYLQAERLTLQRRLVGLDVSPKWVPWLGKVIDLHYRGEPIKTYSLQ